LNGPFPPARPSGKAQYCPGHHRLGIRPVIHAVNVYLLPHAVIRHKVYDKKFLAKALRPQVHGFEIQGIPGNGVHRAVAPEDCTGWPLCIEACRQGQDQCGSKIKSIMLPNQRYANPKQPTGIFLACPRQTAHLSVSHDKELAILEPYLSSRVPAPAAVKPLTSTDVPVIRRPGDHCKCYRLSRSMVETCQPRPNLQ